MEVIDLKENFLETDETVKVAVTKALEGMDEHSRKIQERVDQMDLIHEDLIVVEKLDAQALKSFLTLTEQSRFDQSRKSFFGKVLAISPVIGEETQEYKKRHLRKLMKEDGCCTVSFNPDSAYSLNVIVPEEFPEIWILSIDNILVRDRGFDPKMAKAKSIEMQIIVERIGQAQKAEKMRQAQRDLSQKMKFDPKVTL